VRAFLYLVVGLNRVSSILPTFCDADRLRPTSMHPRKSFPAAAAAAGCCWLLEKFFVREHRSRSESTDTGTYVLEQLYAGDGFTYREDDRQGMAEYVTINQRRSQLVELGTQLQHCAIGSATLEECFECVCSELHRMRSELEFLMHGQ
jgi:hypothetical protein